jgi:F0F1-type ATP synthase alpha subunit
MDINAFFPDRYLKPVHLGTHEVTVIVEKVETVEVGFPKRQCPVISFKNKTKSLILNRKKAMAISQVFGSETTLWIGRQVRLAAVQVKFGDRFVDTIQVTPIAADAVDQAGDKGGHTTSAPAPAPGPELEPRASANVRLQADTKRDDVGNRPRPGVVFAGRRG